MLSECIYTSGGGGNPKVITKAISSWTKGANETVNYADAGLSQVDFIICYGARASGSATYPFMSLWFSNMNSSGSSVQQFYNTGASNIIPTSVGSTTTVGSTSQAVTDGISVISDTSGVLTLQNICSYQANISNVTLIVGQFVHETS